VPKPVKQTETSPALREQRVPRLLLATALSLLFSCGIGLALLAGDWMTILFFGSYALAGSLLVVRRPRNPIGWLLVTIGWVLGVSSLSIPASVVELKAGNASFGAELLAWSTVSFTAIGATALPVLALVFPSGRLPSGRWRLAIGAAVLVALAFGVAYSFAPTMGVTPDRASEGITVPNPFAILPDLFLWQFLPPFVVLFLYILLLLAAGAAAMVVRYRRTSGVERLQLRWVVAALGFAAVATIGGLFAFDTLGNVAFIPATIAFPAVPAAITVAVLRYRLYDIDLLVNRTLVYGTAAAVVAAAFALVNVGAQRLVEAVTHQRSDLVTGALVVVAALAFGPTLRLVRPVADRLLPRRAVLTLLFTDIVESTRKAVELGDEAWRELLSRYRSTVRRELARTGGNEVDTAGDGFFATFDRPDAGLICAWQVRAGVERLGLDTRTGLHVGECETRGEKVTGVAVHVAARVMSLAGPGEILMSDALREAIGTIDVSLRDRGRHQLKGVPGEWQLYGVQELAPSRARS
jgi:class 3 adenylate cyclase